MRIRPAYSALVTLAAATLVLLALPLESDARAPAYAQAAPAQPAWTSATVLAAPPAAPPALLGSVGISVMPHTDQFCSVETAGTPASCSVDPAIGRGQCSAHCDSSQFCSVDGRSATPSPAACSTYALPRIACSTLQSPVGVPGTFASVCSVYSADGVSDLVCSTMEPGPQKQYCSVENPGTPGNFCSTREALNGGTECSVIQSQAPARSFCSVAYGGQKLCTAGESGRCSIAPGGNGACTTFRRAAPGTCSAFSANANCSVIGGPGPSTGGNCRQP